MKSLINRVSCATYNPSIGLLILRLAIGAIFLNAGILKYQSFMKILGFMSSLGVPHFLVYIVVAVEILGGLALIFGIATRFAGLSLGIVMIVAVFLTGIGRGFSAHLLELAVGAGSFALAFIGSGKYSVMKMECNNCGGMLCAGSTCVKPN